MKKRTKNKQRHQTNSNRGNLVLAAQKIKSQKVKEDVNVDECFK